MITNDITAQKIMVESEERLKVLSWLSPLNFGTRLSEMLDRKAADTGIWLLESEQFTSWVNGNIQVLWCPGMREYKHSLRT